MACGHCLSATSSAAASKIAFGRMRRTGRRIGDAQILRDRRAVVTGGLLRLRLLVDGGGDALLDLAAARRVGFAVLRAVAGRHAPRRRSG